MMGPSDLVRDVIAGNLHGAEENAAATEAKIAELQVELERFESEREKYGWLMSAHEPVKS